jgi:hypothetical protein
MMGVPPHLCYHRANTGTASWWFLDESSVGVVATEIEQK